MSRIMVVPGLLGNVPREAAEKAAPAIVQMLARNVRAETPVWSGGHGVKHSPNLKHAVRSKVYRRGEFLGEVSLGLGVKPPTYYAHLVVGGTNPHSLAPKSNLKKAKWALSKRKWGWHPGTAPNPVLDRALERTGGQIAEALATAAQHELEKAAREIEARNPK